MPTARHPVLLVEDHQGFVTALLVENPAVAGLGRGDRQALALLEAHLGQLARRFPLLVASPALASAALIELTVPIRPGYRVDGRDFPSGADVAVRVACVHGRRAGGLHAGFLPLLGIAFDLPEGASLRDFVERAARNALDGEPPARLVGELPPRQYRLAEAVVRVPERARAPHSRSGPEALAQVAEPVASLGGRQGLRAFERDREVSSLAARLAQGRHGILLTGPSGTGKTTVLAEAVRRLEQAGGAGAGGRAGAVAARLAATQAALGRRPRPASGEPRHWLTSAAELIAGMRYLGQWEERLERVIRELQAIDGVLCVASLLDLIRLGGRGPGDSLAQFLLPYLAHGEVRLVGEATDEELDAARRLLPGFADLFDVLPIAPLGPREAARVLARTAEQARTSRELAIEGGVPELVAGLFARFAPYAALPGQAVRFVRELVEASERRRARPLAEPGSGSGTGSESGAGSGSVSGSPSGPGGAGSSGGSAPAPAPTPASAPGPGPGVTRQAALRLFSRQTGLPEALLRDDVPLALDSVVAALAREVIGQPHAVRLAAELVVAVKAGLHDPARPLGVLLLVGPTGVGKTELAKALARWLYGQGAPAEAGAAALEKRGDRLIRIDLSEYATPGAAERLLGARGGDPGLLVRRIRDQPFSVVLLDEVEKASPEVFDLLLGAFDEGRLTDAFGRVTSFKSALILMTSNLGADRDEGLGFAGSGPPAWEDEALRFFRPELLNRIDAVVGFERLSESAVRAIARKEVAAVASRDGLRHRGLRLEVEDGLLEALAAAGFDPRYGARPLQRAIEDRLVTPLARYLAERPDLRDRTVRALGGDGDDGGTRFEVHLEKA